jgi:hypothetical protein
MKKIIGLSLLATLALVSCKKNEAAEQLQTNSSEVTPLQKAPVMESDLIGGAHKGPQTTLALSEPSFDFGKIKKGEVVEHVYEVTNTGKNPLIISNVQPTCGCTVPDFTKDPILPGQKGKITLKFNSANFDGVVHKSAEVYANVEKIPVELTFTADIQP